VHCQPDAAPPPDTGPKPGILFNDGFGTYDTKTWKTGSCLGNNLGAPQTLTATSIGTTALHMRSVFSGNNQSRSIFTQQTFTATTNVVLEARFKPVGKLDGVLVLYLCDASTSKTITMTMFSGNFGKDHTVSATMSGQSGKASANQVWKWGEWLRLRVTAKGGTVTAQLLDDNGKARWSHTFNAPLKSALGTYRIGLGQSMGIPGTGTWITETYMDWVRLTQL